MESEEQDFVSRDKYQAQVEKVNELKNSIEELFANEIKQIKWKEEVEKLDELKNLAESNYDDAVTRYETQISEASSKHAAELKALKSAHLLEVTDIENAYEDRLVSMTNKIRVQQNDHLAMDERRLSELSVKESQHEAQISELAAINQTAEKALEEKINCIKDEKDKSEKMRIETISQQEEEYESELVNQSFEYEQKIEDNKTSIDDVTIQNQKLVAKKLWLEEQARELKSQVIDVQHERIEESCRCKKLVGEIDRIKGILKEKNEIIAQIKEESNTLTGEKNQLEKELYVTNAKCEDFEQERVPLEQSIKEQKKEATMITWQLKESRSQNDALQQTIELNQHRDRAKNAEIKSLRSTIRNRERQLKVLEGELVQLAGITDNKTLRNQVKQSIKKLDTFN